MHKEPSIYTARKELMDIYDRIQCNPLVCNGKPVIKGTRIPLNILLEQIAENVSWDQILYDYPELKKEDIQACLLFASSSIEHSEIREIYA
jgi:uncharacterized protein (DUF433 family)